MGLFLFTFCRQVQSNNKSQENLIMGRMHAPGKGISQSALPYRRSVPTWLKLSSADVKEQIFKLAKKGLTPSQIGYPQGFTWCRSSSICNREQNFENPQVERFSSRFARRYLLSHQESSLYQKTS